MPFLLPLAWPLCAALTFPPSTVVREPAPRAQQAAPGEKQEPAQPRKNRGRKPERKDYSPEFVTLSNAWKGALDEYASALLRYDRANAGLPVDKRDPKGRPAHPASQWWSRFLALGEGGDADALAWLVDQAPDALPDRAARADAVEKALLQLVRAHPEHPALEDALDALKGLFDDLGRERMLKLVDQVQAQAKGPENQARALFFRTWVMATRLPAIEPKLAAQLQELYNQVLIAYPRTRAAREASGYVFPELERGFVRAELDWVARVRELQGQKKPPAEWPRQPMHEWFQKYLPLAAAGAPQASQFVNRTYPAYQQAEGNGLQIGLVWLQAFWTQHAPAGMSDWMLARLGLIEVLTHQYLGEPALTSALVDLTIGAESLPVPELERALAPVIADPSHGKAHALALYLMAMAHLGRGQSADWTAARSALEELVEKHPTEDIADKAQKSLAQLRTLWPGAVAPDFRGTDQDGLAFTLADYKGFVVVLDFVSAGGGLGAEEIAQRRALIRDIGGRPFRWIGGVLEAHTARSFHDQLTNAGVDWRCAILGSRGCDVAANYGVLNPPTVVVIDGEGVIRGRNLPWAEQRTLLEKLVAEAEAKRAPR